MDQGTCIASTAWSGINVYFWGYSERVGGVNADDRVTIIMNKFNIKFD